MTVNEKILMNSIVKLLPGFNCNDCGYKRCDEFAVSLEKNSAIIDLCPFLEQHQFKSNRETILEILTRSKKNKSIQEKIIGLIDNYEADFILNPLNNDCSCREVLAPFLKTDLVPGQVIRYRPLGCPIIHFAKIISVDYGLLTVVIVGPCNRMNPDFNFIELGTCMVVSFEGAVEGKSPKVGQTVKFLPNHCMMKKVHSGVVVQLEGRNVKIDCIDLKVWEHTKCLSGT